MYIVTRALSIFWGFSTGVVISTGIVAFLTVVGIIPRLASKTNITKHYYAFGTSVLLGSTVGCIFYLYDVSLPLSPVVLIPFALAFGVFVGCLCIAVAEMLDVIPILKRRAGIKHGLYLFLLSFAVGKVIGALYYWFYPGFLS